MTAATDRTIKASPTKEFFISMLVRDIELTRAIIDLVDNSVDGARRIHGDGPFTDRWVRVEFTPEYFRIADNCGGISVEIARNYAFRFGRPPGMPQTPHSVGQFGVGMKRALFKMGSKFTVVSRTENSYFFINEDVNEWKEDTGPEWGFDFEELKEGVEDLPAGEPGTSITVTDLIASVAEDFGLDTFETQLATELRQAQQKNIENGLSITLNGTPLNVRPIELLSSANLAPAHRLLRYKEQTATPVTVKLYAGLGRDDDRAAGWYLYCNGRMIVGADQSSVTGWATGTIPKYHPQFAWFRGYAFFDCDDASLLPWNTTKTGVDLDNDIFRTVRLEMIGLMRPVIDFLNALADEKRKGEEDGAAQQLVSSSAPRVRLDDITNNQPFSAPKTVRASVPRVRNISYSKPIEQVNRVMRVLGVTKLKEVGEQTFDYYYRLECED